MTLKCINSEEKAELIKNCKCYVTFNNYTKLFAYKPLNFCTKLRVLSINSRRLSQTGVQYLIFGFYRIARKPHSTGFFGYLPLTYT